jgi:hypothetical protein
VTEYVGNATGQESNIRLDLPGPQPDMDQFQQPRREIGLERRERFGLEQGNQELTEFENAFGVVDLPRGIELGHVILDRCVTTRTTFLVQRRNPRIVRVLEAKVLKQGSGLSPVPQPDGAPNLSERLLLELIEMTQTRLGKRVDLALFS